MESWLLPALMVLAVGGMFLMSRRNRQQQAKQSEFRDTLEPGQQVMTSSGQLGAVVDVVGDAVTIETTPGVYTRWVKAAITAVPPQFASVLEEPGEDEDEDDVEYDVENAYDDDDDQDDLDQDELDEDDELDDEDEVADAVDEVDDADEDLDEPAEDENGDESDATASGTPAR